MRNHSQISLVLFQSLNLHINYQRKANQVSFHVVLLKIKNKILSQYQKYQQGTSVKANRVHLRFIIYSNMHTHFQLGLCQYSFEEFVNTQLRGKNGKSDLCPQTPQPSCSIQLILNIMQNTCFEYNHQSLLASGNLFFH